MAFDVEGALKAGYSEQEIANFLGQQRKFDTQAAIASGYSPGEIIQHLAQGAPAKQAPWSLSDTLVSAAQGAVGGAKSLVTGLTGAGTGASEVFDPAQKWLGEKLSPERRAEQQRRALLEQEAAKTGKPLEEVSAGLGGIKEAPVQTVAQGIGSAVPTVLLGAGAAALGAAVGAPVAIAAGVGIGLKYLLGGIQGAGEVKGSIYDAVKQELEDNKVPEAAAKQQAIAAQDYLGKNWGTISAGMGVGALAGGTGVESTLLKRLSKPVAARAAADVAKDTAQKGAGRELVGAIAKEAGTEGLQGGQEKYAENVALTREGYLRDAMAGVYGAAARDAAMGALTGAAVQPLAKSRPAAEQPPVQEPSPPEQELRPTAEPPKPIAERPTAELDLEIARISALADKREATPQEMADLKAMRAEVRNRGIAEIEGQRAAAAADIEGAKKFPALAGTAPTQTEMREALPEGPLPPETDLFGAPVQPPAAPEEVTPATPKELEAAGQMRLQPPGAITATEVKQFGTMSKKNRQWLVDNVEGKTPEEVRDMVEADPTILTRVPGVAKAIKEIIASATPKEAPSATTTKIPPVEQPVEPRGREPSVGVPSEPAGAVPSEPGAGGAPAAAAPATPDQRGLVPTEQPAGEGNVPEGAAPAPLTPREKPDYASMSREELQAIRDNASTANLEMDVNAIRRYFGDAAANAYQGMNVRQRNKWWDANATTELEEASSVFNGVDEATIDEYINAHNNFDIESPQALGRSVALLARNVNDPAFVGSPAYVTLRNALAYAKQQGWSEAEVLNAMRGRAKEWAGRDAEELFKSLFKKAPAAPTKPAKPALPPAAPAGMFGQLVKPGTPDLTEEEAAAPAPAASAPAPSVWEGKGGSRLGTELEAATEDEKKAAAAAKRAKRPSSSTISATPPVQEAAKPVEAAKPAEGPQKPLREQMNDLMDEMRALEDQAKALLTKAGRIPNEGTEKRKQWEALTDKVRELKMTKFIELDRKLTAEKKAQAAKPAEAPKPKGPRTELETVDAINGKSLLEVAQWGAVNFTDPDFRLLAKCVADTLQILKNVGLQIGDITVTDPGKRISGGARGATHYSYSKSGAAASKVSIMLNHPANGAQSGTTDRTILHELIHAATTGAIRVGNLQRAKGTRVSKTINDLYDVSNAVFAHVDAKAARGETLSETEQRLRTNYMRDVNEVLAWTLTDRDMQAYMETVPYKGTNAWDKFVTLIRDMLGLTPKADTALSEILRVSGELTALKEADLAEATKVTGKQFSLSPTAGGTRTPNATLVAQSQPLIPKSAGVIQQMQNAVATATGKNSTVSLATRVRTALVDPFASVEQRISKDYDQGITDAIGDTTATVVARQAQDVTKLMQAFYEDGALVVNPKTRMLEVQKGKHAPDDLFPIIRKMAEDLGMGFEEGFAYTSTVLEGMKLNELVKANASGATDVLIHWRTPNNAIDYAKINAAVAEYNSDPRYKQLSDIMDAPRIGLINELEKAGRLTPETAKEWREVTHYVPFDREGDGPAFAAIFSSAKKNSSKGLARLGQLPKLLGSDWRPVSNVFENYFKTMGWLAGQLAKQNATSYMMGAMVNAGFASKLYNPKMSKTGLTVPVYEQGEETHYEVASKWDQMAFLDKNGSMPSWVKFFAQVGGVLRTAVTANPIFAATQVVQDVQGALLFSGVRNPLAFVSAAVGNFGVLAWHETVNAYKAARGEITTTHKIEQDMRRLGLSGEVDYTAANPAMEELFRQGVRKRTKLGSTTLGAIIHGLEQITHSSDLAVRKALYDDEMRRSNDVLQASTKAREMINFRRRGSSQWVQHWVAMVPFFNAALQSTDIVYRAVTSKADASGLARQAARTQFKKNIAMYGGAALVYALMRSGDDDYEDMDRRVRDSNWVFPGNVRIPIRGDMGVVKVAIENGVDYMRRHGTPEELDAIEALKTAMWFAYEQYVGRNVRAPTAIQPLLENFANFSFMTGRAQIGTYQQGKPRHLQETSGTTETAKAVASFVEQQLNLRISPVHIDNVLRGYLGTTAASITMLTDAAIYPDRPDRPLHKMVALGAFAWDETQLTNPKNEFYALQEKVLPVLRAFNDIKTSDPDRAEQYAAEHETELMLAATINQTLNELSEIRQYEKYLRGPESAKESSTEERAAELLQLQKQAGELVDYVREIRHELKI